MSNSNQDRSTKGKNHVVYYKDVPRIKIEIPNSIEATMYLSTLDESNTNLAEMTYELNKLTSNDKLKIVYNSNGGLVTEGKILINTIQSTGVFKEFELLSNAASMAAVLFCIGDRRIVHENSSIMFHTFSGGTFGKGREMKDATKHKNKNINSFIRSHIVGLTDKELSKMVIGKEYWFGTEKMCQRGIATHVRIGENLITAEKYLKILKKTKKIAKKQKYEISTLSEAFLYGIDAISPLTEKTHKEYDVISDKLTQLSKEHDLLLQ